MGSPDKDDAGADLSDSSDSDASENWQRSEGDPCPRCRLPALRFFDIEGDGASMRICGGCMKRARAFHEGMRARREFLLGRIEGPARKDMR